MSSILILLFSNIFMFSFNKKIYKFILSMPFDNILYYFLFFSNLHKLNPLVKDKLS